MRLRVVAAMTVVMVIRPDEIYMGEEGYKSKYENTGASDSAESATSVVTISPPWRRNTDRLDQRSGLVGHLFGLRRESAKGISLAKFHEGHTNVLKAARGTAE